MTIADRTLSIRCQASTIAQNGMTTADTWLLVFSWVFSFSTLVYAFLTWRLVSETKRLRVAQTEPIVSVTYLM